MKNYLDGENLGRRELAKRNFRETKEVRRKSEHKVEECGHKCI